MGSFAGTIAYRDAANASRAFMASTHNYIHAAILATGMTQVVSADYPGQAGTFVAATAGSGETEVQNPGVSPPLVARLLDGYKLYKHPTQAMWLRVNYYTNWYTNGGGTQYRTTEWGFVASGELAGGVLTTGKTNAEVFGAQLAASGVSLAGTTTASVTLTANCGADNFWIHAAGGNMLLAAGGTSFTTPTDPLTSLAFGMFSGGSGTIGALSTIHPTSTGPSWNGVNLTTFPGPRSTRSWAYDGSSWAACGCSAFGMVIDPALTTAGGALRVARANKIIAGVRRFFRFGFITRSVVSEGDIVSIDLDGLGAKNYKACLALGAASPNSPVMATTEYCVHLLPWGH